MKRIVLMVALRSELERSLGSWRCHLPQCWLDVIGNAAPAFSQIADSVRFCTDHPIFPNFEHSDSHVFRAFRQLTPSNVKVVLIGQDPYPSCSQATGRAFDQGDLDVWVPLGDNEPPIHCARSLQSIVQQLATLRTECQAYSESNGGWNAFKEDIRPGARLDNCVPTPTALFDQWQNEGVLLLNAALTFTRKSQRHCHATLWRPFVQAVISHLACCETAPVFMCFGNKAWKILGEDVQTTLNNRGLVVRRAHPVRKRCFLGGRNVFKDANEKLAAAGRCEVSF